MGIKELARHLNISIGTVSRALNGHPEVNAETRKRVLEAAAELGYAPDQAGRSLRQGTLNVVALLLSTDLTSKTDTMFFMELSRGIQDQFAEHGLDLVIHLNKPGLNMLDRVKRIVERRQADALILAETRDNDPRLDYLAGRGFPFATMGRSWSGGTHPWMDLDFDFAMRAAIDRLAGFGHRRVALVTGDPGYRLDSMLQDAFRRELAGHGLAVDEALMIKTDTHEQGGYKAMTDFLAMAEPPTAVIFPHYRAVVGAYSYLSNPACSQAATWQSSVARPIPPSPIHGAAAHLLQARPLWSRPPPCSGPACLDAALCRKLWQRLDPGDLALGAGRPRQRWFPRRLMPASAIPDGDGRA